MSAAPARLRVGVVGGGLIAQAAHLPSLRLLESRFEVAALADPSAIVRERVAARFGIPRVFADPDELLALPGLDAVLVLTPAFSHAELVLAALGAGLHVFVEKPLCIGVADADRIIAARERAGRVLQVAYMKRFDLAYEGLLAELAGLEDELRLVNVITFDTGLSGEPYFAADWLALPTDLPDELREAGRRSLARQLAEVFGDERLERVGAFAGIHLDALVHEVNLVQGALDALGMGDPTPQLNALAPDGRGATALLRLANGGEWHLSFFYADRVAHFEERVELYFPSRIDRLTFGAPYLQENATRHERLTARDLRVVGRPGGSHRGSYVAQLAHFHACVVDGAACRTPAEMARRDIALLTELFRTGLA